MSMKRTNQRQELVEKPKKLLRLILIYILQSFYYDKEFNFAEVIESVPIPIIADSMAICIAKQFSIVFSTCMAHTLHNVLKGTIKKADEFFDLSDDEWRKCLNFVTWSRTGWTKEQLKDKVKLLFYMSKLFFKGVPQDMPQKLNDFFWDKSPTEEEKMTMYDLRNKDLPLSAEERKKRAEKIDCFPLMQVNCVFSALSCNVFVLSAKQVHFFPT